jgi:hypothetical protein
MTEVQRLLPASKTFQYCHPHFTTHSDYYATLPESTLPPDVVQNMRTDLESARREGISDDMALMASLWNTNGALVMEQPVPTHDGHGRKDSVAEFLRVTRLLSRRYDGAKGLESATECTVIVPAR